MRLSAIDIKKQEFKKSFRGYDVGEVEAYLDTVANELEKMYRENETLKEQVSSLEKDKEDLSREIQVFRDNEKTFQKAIVKSQDLSEDIIENATKRAELIVKEAEIVSSRTKLQAQEEIMNLRQELEELRVKNESIIEDIRNFLLEKLNLIEEYSKNRKIMNMESNVTPLTDISVEKEEEQKNFGMDLNIDESQ
jgi:cell division initiation protein